MAHRSVLLQEAIDGLALKKGDIVVDATVGGGGHAKAICSIIGENGFLIGLDRDADALERTRIQLVDAPCRVELREADFRTIDGILSDLCITTVDAILFDLGWSSDQLEKSGRGFGLKNDEPLLMTYKVHPTEEDITAREILNNWHAENIETILRGYGEERFAKNITQEIVKARDEHPFKTTNDLVETIRKAVPAWYRHKKIHFATKTFQALRIATNDEVEGLREGLVKAYDRICPKGRIAVISFHSIEDRIVKHFFKRLKDDGKGGLITKKVMKPSETEVRNNPRARSAKLRIFEKQ